jgi:hypothetical protein
MRPTQALSVGKYRHLRLTTKDVNKGFYKGNRTGAMGRHTKYGGYIIEWNRVRTYAVPPNLAECQVREREERMEHARDGVRGTDGTRRDTPGKARLRGGRDDDRPG